MEKRKEYDSQLQEVLDLREQIRSLVEKKQKLESAVFKLDGARQERLEKLSNLPFFDDIELAERVRDVYVTGFERKRDSDDVLYCDCTVVFKLDAPKDDEDHEDEYLFSFTMCDAVDRHGIEHDSDAYWEYRRVARYEDNELNDGEAEQGHTLEALANVIAYRVHYSEHRVAWEETFIKK